jgi:hypothetical protein
MRSAGSGIAIWIIGLVGVTGDLAAHASEPSASFPGLGADDEVLWAAIRGRLSACSDLAVARHVFGDAIVHLDEHDPARRVVAIEVTTGLPAEIVRCAREKLASAVAEVSVRPHVIEARVPRTGVSRDFALGTPRPLLPAADRLIAVWTGLPAGRVRRELRELVPGDVAVDEDACLDIPWTRTIQEGFGLWLNATRARVAERWLDAFTGVQNPGAPAWAHARHVPAPGGRVRHRAVLWTQNRFLVVDQATLRAPGIRRLDHRPTRLCPHESTSVLREALAAAVAAGGRCLPSDLDTALIAPRYAFPARRFVSIDASERQACAIDVSGAVECCGAGAGPAPPPPFSSVSAGTVQSCGVRPDHSWACWGPSGAPVLPPNALPARVDQISTAGGWTCALGSDGAVTSLHDRGFVPVPVPMLGPIRRVRAGLDSCCALALDGALTCWNADHADRRETPLVDVGAPWASCGLAADGTPWCRPIDDHRVETPATRFSSAVFNTVSGCGVDKTSGAIVCWGAATAPSPARTFSSITGVPGSFCGLRGGAVTCWGWGWQADTHGEGAIP